MSSIFVQIASYRDPELIPTIKDMLLHAYSKEPINICVCWQHGPEEHLDIFDEIATYDNTFDYKGGFRVHQYRPNLYETTGAPAHLTVIDVPYLKTKGACWARNFIQQFYCNETYTLQLDSHHRFVPQWDLLCIDMLEKLRENSDKPLLTAYLPSYEPANDPAKRIDIPWRINFDKFTPDGVVLTRPGAIDNWKELSAPVPAYFYSGHFTFADGCFAEEIQHDPEFFFHGEEISISARAYTHGYDMYHPHIVVAWHEYTRQGRPKVWDDLGNTAKANGEIEAPWWDLDKASLARNRALFGMGENVETKYGLGTIRSLAQYENYAGVCFATRVGFREVGPGCQSFRITFSLSELENGDYDFWYVAAHDEAGEIFRKDLVPEEILFHAKDGTIDYNFAFVNDRIPTHYLVWPHCTTRGWLPSLKKEVTK